MSKVSINLFPPRGRVSCTPTWTLSAMERVRALPDRKRFQDKVMHFELTPGNISHIRAAFPQAEIVAPLEGSSRRLVSGPRQPFSTILEPTALQQEADEASAPQRFFAFFEKPGSGKTKMVLDKAVRAWCDGLIDGLFILSYATVHEQWVRDEMPKHIDPSIPLQSSIWLSGRKPDRSILGSDPDVFRVLSMNYEAYAVSKKALAFAKEFAYSGEIMCVLDESQRIKNPETLIGATLTANREDWPMRVIASGEPTPLGIQDYYNQFKFLDPSIIGAWSYTGFKGMYCRMGGFENQVVVGYHNTEQLHRHMAPYVHVGEPDIPSEQVFELSRFDLGPKARAAYDQMKEELLVDLRGEDGEMKMAARAPNILARMVRLQEIACERLTTLEGDQLVLGDNRIKLLKSVLAIHSGKKAIIWSKFVADHDLQAEVLGEAAAVFNGQTPAAQRADIIERFKDPDSELRYLIASAGAAGTGLNLQGACQLNVYYSNNHNAGQYWQSLKRTHRLGTTGDVLYIDLLARNTIDVGILNSNRRKRNVADMSFQEFLSILEEKDVEEWG